MCELLTSLASQASGQYLHPNPAQPEAWITSETPADAAPRQGHAPVARGVMLSLVEDLVARELPLLHAELHAAGMPSGLPAARWLDTCWLNFLTWRSLVTATLLPLMLGADFVIFQCVAAMRHVSAMQHAASPSATLSLRMLLPLEHFDLLAELPYMLELRRRHGERCQAAMSML